MKNLVLPMTLSAAFGSSAVFFSSYESGNLIAPQQVEIEWDHPAGQADILDIVDFDQDGFDDLLVGYPPDGAAIYLNQSGSGFIKIWEYANCMTYFDDKVQAGDMNGDGFPDVVRAGNGCGGSSEIEVWFNQIPNHPFCASDLDKTGNVDFSDLLFVLNEWGECGQQIN